MNKLPLCDDLKKIIMLSPRSMFIRSVKLGNIDNIEWIYKNFKLDVDNYDTMIDAIIAAIKSNKINSLKFLHQIGAEINFVFNYIPGYLTPYNNIDVVKYLHKNGADIHINNDYLYVWASMNDDNILLDYLNSFIVESQEDIVEFMLHCAKKRMFRCTLNWL
jgi:hypothetical protein